MSDCKQVRCPLCGVPHEQVEISGGLKIIGCPQLPTNGWQLLHVDFEPQKAPPNYYQVLTSTSISSCESKAPSDILQKEVERLREALANSLQMLWDLHDMASHGKKYDWNADPLSITLVMGEAADALKRETPSESSEATKESGTCKQAIDAIASKLMTGEWKRKGGITVTFPQKSPQSAPKEESGTSSIVHDPICPDCHLGFLCMRHCGHEPRMKNGKVYCQVCCRELPEEWRQKLP